MSALQNMHTFNRVFESLTSILLSSCINPSLITHMRPSFSGHVLAHIARNFLRLTSLGAMYQINCSDQRATLGWVDISCRHYLCFSQKHFLTFIAQFSLVFWKIISLSCSLNNSNIHTYKKSFLTYHRKFLMCQEIMNGAYN